MDEKIKTAARNLAANQIGKGFKPRALHEYQDKDGNPIYWRIRLKHDNGDKWIRPMRKNGNSFELGEPQLDVKPLYRLPDIKNNPDDDIWIVEGENKADALTKLGMVATTSGSATSADRADWLPLENRKVIIWPDKDEAGLNYAKDIIRELGQLNAEVRLVDVKKLDVPDKGDVVDWLDKHPESTKDDVLLLPTVQALKIAKSYGQIPKGYSCDKKGVFQNTDEDKSPICLTHKPVFVEALSRDGSRENWGRLVCWKDHDGELHQRAINAGRMHTKGNDLSQELANAGLPIVPGKETALLKYLAAFNPDKRLVAAPTTGWVNNVFVLPNKIIGQTRNEIVFQPVTYHAAAAAIYSKGTLEEWQEHIAKNAENNLLLSFAISASLAAMMRLFSGIEAGGFNFYGRTSNGKTTLLQVAGSACGNSSDPAITGGDDVYLRRWNMTSNAMEGIAEAHNDLPLIIDEIGESDAQGFGKSIYKLMSGTGKGRSDRTGGARKTKKWRTWVLSAGEVPVSTHITENGQKVRGGQLVRFIDIPVDSIFPDAESADRMKKSCAHYFGTAGPAFIEVLIEMGSGALQDEMKKLNEIAKLIGEATTPESKRVRKRFALIAASGFIAIKKGILPWQQEIALNACKAAYALWQDNSKGVSDADRGIVNIRDFILQFGKSRFEHEGDNRTILNRAGWYKENYYHFTTKAFDEACNGVLRKTALNELSRHDLLRRERVSRNGNRILVSNERVSVYSVSKRILSTISIISHQLKPNGGSENNQSNQQSSTISTASTIENTKVQSSGVT